MAWREYNAGATGDDFAGRRRKTRGETVLAALLHAVSKLVLMIGKGRLPSRDEPALTLVS
jgi:hypothetical protein